MVRNHGVKVGRSAHRDGLDEVHDRAGERRVVDRAQVISGEIFAVARDPGSERIGWADEGVGAREHHGGHGDPIQGAGSQAGHAGWRQVPSDRLRCVGEPRTPGARSLMVRGRRLECVGDRRTVRRSSVRPSRPPTPEDDERASAPGTSRAAERTHRVPTRSTASTPRRRQDWMSRTMASPP